MTCVVIIVSREAVHVFGDSAAIGPTGRLVKSGSKIMKFERARMCAVARGSVAHAWRLRRIVEQFASYDEARAGIVGRLCGPAGWPWRLAGPFELYVAGTSGAGAPSAFMLVSHRKHEGIEPMMAIDVPYAVATGPAPDLDAERDPIGFGVRAAELQRGVLQPIPFSRKPASIVGGYLEHAVISAGGIETQVLGGCNDRLGERLNPRARFSASGAWRSQGLEAGMASALADCGIYHWRMARAGSDPDGSIAARPHFTRDDIPERFRGALRDAGRPVGDLAPPGTRPAGDAAAARARGVGATHPLALHGRPACGRGPGMAVEAWARVQADGQRRGGVGYVRAFLRV